MVSNVRLKIGAKVRHPVHGVGRIAWHARYDGRLELAVKFPAPGGGWKTRFLTVDERDEAREAARWFYETYKGPCIKETQAEALDCWSWLEETQ